MDSLRRASGFLFYLLGSITLIVVVLERRNIGTSFTAPFLSLVDLPLILIAMLYGGSSLVASLSKGKEAPMLTAIVFVPLGILFLVFCWLNFAYPFSDLG